MLFLKKETKENFKLNFNFICILSFKNFIDLAYIFMSFLCLFPLFFVWEKEVELLINRLNNQMIIACYV